MSVRAHNISRFCKRSMNLNFGCRAAATCSSSSPQTPPRSSSLRAATSRSLQSAAALEQSRPRTWALGRLKCRQLFLSDGWTVNWMESKLLMWLTHRMSAQVPQTQPNTFNQTLTAATTIYFEFPQIVERWWRRCPTWRLCVSQMRRVQLLSLQKEDAGRKKEAKPQKAPSLMRSRALWSR